MTAAKKVLPIVLMLAACSACCYAGLTRHDVLVIANSNSARSQAVAEYYRQSRDIPESHVRLVSCPTGSSITPDQFFDLRDQIAAHLLSLGSVPDDPESDPIKVIVLTTGIPHYVSDSAERYASVDSALTLTFSENEWGKGPFGVYGPFWPSPGSLNAYSGDYAPASSFDSFRSGADRSVFREEFPTPGFTLVRMLDETTALAAGGGGLLYRGVFSAGEWAWSAVSDENKAAIGWPVSDLSVLDSTHAYACTGNHTKPHGGGTIIATSDGGLTWTRLRRTSRTSVFKLKEALVAVDFADTLHGWAVGTSYYWGTATSALMIRTTDGGSNWQDISASLPASFLPKAVTAADADNLWICGAQGKIYRSTDGGDSWAAANSGAPVKDYNDIWIKSDGGSFKGWAVGEDGTIIRTENGSSWTIQAAGLTTADIIDLAVYDHDSACAAYGGDSFLVYTSGSGWQLESPGLAPIVSAASAGAGVSAAVGGTRYVFADGPTGWRAVYEGRPSTWRLRYLVNRLDGYSDDVNPQDGIPDDIKAMIDRACAADSGGRFILDERVIYPDGTPDDADTFQDVYNSLLAIVGSSNVTWNRTATYLTGQSNVMGYASHGMHDGNANDYTTWGRPFNTWADGAVATVYESTDGREMTNPKFVWGMYVGGTQYANKLSLSAFPSWPVYSGYRLVLHASDGSELASDVIASGTAQIDLGGVAWPADHKTYVQIYFPSSDPLHPGQPVEHARYPWSGSNTDVYDNRSAGFALKTSYARTLMVEFIREGCTGGIANVDEPWFDYAGRPDYMFPGYARGFTWGESAYMGLKGLGWQEVALGDPLMAPYATPPVVSITSPSSDGQTFSGTIHAYADASPVGAPGIRKVAFYLGERLIGEDYTAPYGIDIDTAAEGIADGIYILEAIAYENDDVQNTGSARRTLIVDNDYAAFAEISAALVEADGALVELADKVVTAVFDGFFYIQDADGTRGIKVRSPEAVAEGQIVTVAGMLATVDGEREIAASSVSVGTP